MHVEDRGEFGGTNSGLSPIEAGSLLFLLCCPFQTSWPVSFQVFLYLYLPSHSGNAGVTNAYHLKTPVGRLSLKVVLPAELSFRSYYHFNSPHYKTNKQPDEKRSEVQISIYFDILYYSSQTILWPYALPVMVYC